MDIRVNKTDFLFYRKNNTLIASAPFKTLVLAYAPGVTEDEQSEAEYTLAEWQAGEEFTSNPTGLIILGPEREFTHVVRLHACGNPDYQQYADIGPKKLVHVVGIEEAIAVCKAYQAHYDMGGGNCARDHGTVYELKNGKRKKIGRVCYGGRYDTLAQIKAFEAEMAAKYGKR